MDSLRRGFRTPSYLDMLGEVWYTSINRKRYSIQGNVRKMILEWGIVKMKRYMYGYVYVCPRSYPVKTRAVRYIRDPVKRCKTPVSIGLQPKAVKLLTMILVMATNARMNVMYVFVRLKVSLTENVFTASPPPRIATSSRPFKHTSNSQLPCTLRTKRHGSTFDSTQNRRTFVRTFA